MMQTSRFLAVLVVAAPTTPPVQKEQIPYIVAELLKRIPPLKHDAAGRLQFITWTPFRMSEKDDSYEKGKPLPKEMYRELGFCPIEKGTCHAIQGKYAAGPSSQNILGTMRSSPAAADQ